MVQHFLNLDDNLPIWLDGIVFALAMLVTELVDKRWIKSEMWSGSNEKK